VVVSGAMAEPSLLLLQPGEKVQFERMGYFCADPVESKPGQPIFNRTVTLKDSWQAINK
jgi:glutaminyl-tRNA synthetase